MSEAEIAERVMVAGTIGLGYALFSDHMAQVLDLDPAVRRAADARVEALVAEIGRLP